MAIRNHLLVVSVGPPPPALKSDIFLGSGSEIGPDPVLCACPAFNLLSPPSVSDGFCRSGSINPPGFSSGVLAQLTVEMLAEGGQQVGRGLVHAHVSPQLPAERRHAFALDAARNDVGEPGQVRVAVQSQTVGRDVAAAVDPCRQSSGPSGGVLQRAAAPARTYPWRRSCCLQPRLRCVGTWLP